MSLYPIPPRNRNPSSITRRGFNEPTDLLLGFPHTAAPHGHSATSNSDSDILDPRPNASLARHDLALQYCYEVVLSYNLGGEYVSVPVVRYVYRRDRDLRKSEIIAFLSTGAIPERYPLRESNGVINEPMNAENFRAMVRRFSLYTTNDYDGPRIRLRERSSGLDVQSHYMQFDEAFWGGPAIMCDKGFLVSSHPQRILAEMQHRFGAKVWYLDSVTRVEGACYRVRTGEWRPIPFTMAEIGARSR
ncbi:hypothetical protein C8R43DRAFT_1132443 [Mycena crocata]|nr:hypothetical protein C8R43DRAFT_1132443 [Mycena crocata]